MHMQGNRKENKLKARADIRESRFYFIKSVFGRSEQVENWWNARRSGSHSKHSILFVWKPRGGNIMRLIQIFALVALFTDRTRFALLGIISEKEARTGSSPREWWIMQIILSSALAPANWESAKLKTREMREREREREARERTRQNNCTAKRLGISRANLDHTLQSCSSRRFDMIQTGNGLMNIWYRYYYVRLSARHVTTRIPLSRIFADD